MKKFTEKISLRLKHYYYCYFVTKVTVMFNDDELKGNVGFYDKCTLFLHGTRKKVIFYEEMEISFQEYNKWIEVKVDYIDKQKLFKFL